MALTGAQSRASQHGPSPQPAIIIGKSDINEGTVEQTVAYPEKHELVSAPYSMVPAFLPARPPKARRALPCRRCSVIGRKFSLCIASPRASDIEKIKLV